MPFFSCAVSSDVRRGVLPGQKRQGLGPTAAACLRAESAPSPHPHASPQSLHPTRHQEAGRWLDFLTAQTARGDAGGGRARLMLKSWRVASRATDTVEAVDSRAPSLRKPREPDQLRRRFCSSLRVWRHPQNWPGHVSHYVGGWGLLSGSAEMHQAGARCKFQRLAIASLRLVLAAPLLPLGSRAPQSARDWNSSCRIL